MTLVYLCPNCEYMRTEEEIELNITTKVIDGEYYPLCVNCGGTYSIYAYKIRKI